MKHSRKVPVCGDESGGSGGWLGNFPQAANSPVAASRMVIPAALQCGYIRILELPGCREIAYGFMSVGPWDRERLAFLLFDMLHKGSSTNPNRPGGALIRLEKDSLGCPHIRVRGCKAPPISFSRADHRLWGVVGTGRGIGIDAASPTEFESPYPYARVFHLREFARISSLCGGGPADTCALLWSVKEAAVKSLGCGFHMLDPLDIEVHNPVLWKGGLLLTAHAGCGVPVWARREHANWVAVAFPS